jgi:hypothetical protein
MRHSWGWVCRGCAACALSWVGCVGDSSNNDAGTDASNDVIVDVAPDVIATDAGPDVAASCDLSKPFGAPVPIAELNTAANELSARLTHDELTIYFQTDPSGDAGVSLAGYLGGGDIATATRAKASDPFGPATILAGVNTASDEYDPSVTGDNLTLYFTSNRNSDGGSQDLWAATRGSALATFGNITNATALDTSSDEATAYVMPDNLTIYFARGVNGYDLFRATRGSTSSTFAVDTSGTFAAVNSPSNIERYPVVTLDELTVYFASDRTGTKGNEDVYKAARTSKSDPFGSVTNVAELNTTGLEQPNWISDDGCRLYLTSVSAGSYDIYIATKPK